MKVLFLLLTFNVMADCHSEFIYCENMNAREESEGIKIDYNLCNESRDECEEEQLELDYTYTEEVL